VNNNGDGGMAAGFCFLSSSFRRQRQRQQRSTAAAAPTTRRTTTTTTTRLHLLKDPPPPPDFTVLDDDGQDDDQDDDEYFARKVSSSSSFATPDYTVFGEEYDERQQPPPATPNREATPRKAAAAGGGTRRGASTSSSSSSWMDRNAAYSGERLVDGDRNNSNDGGGTFRKTRVYVQGLPPTCTWQQLKDHFRVAGTPVFASVSQDLATGRSKGCGIVQFESAEQARNAIRVMRNHPMKSSKAGEGDGEEEYQLYVREDVQEQQQFSPKAKKGPTPPTKWKCADEEMASLVFDGDEDRRRAVLRLIKDRDFARRKRNYDESDRLRELLKQEHSVHVDDRLKLWWTSLDGYGQAVPDSIREINGEGRWGKAKEWRQIPTTPENDSRVDAELVSKLLRRRDEARRVKDFETADALLEQARTCPDGHLNLRIHDESRTWRIWTDDKPPPTSSSRERQQPSARDDTGDSDRAAADDDPRRRAASQCLSIIREHAPHREEEIVMLLEKFVGREYNMLKKLKQRYSNTGGDGADGEV